MVQKSYPWPRGVAADSLVGYTAKEWYAAWVLMAKAGGVVVDASVYSDATLYNRGVFYSAANRLAVTSPGANRIDVASGAALVDGAMFYNTAIIMAAADIGSPTVNPRVDRVVVRKNFGALPYTPAAASVALFTVPAYTARVTVIHGAENVAPVAPTLTQDTTRATYWDIPLFQYQISLGGVITFLTDERDWVDAKRTHVFVPALCGQDNVGVEIPLALGDVGMFGVTLVDGVDDLAYGYHTLPTNYIYGSLTPTGKFLARAGATTGNVLAEMWVQGGACSQAFTTRSHHYHITVAASDAQQVINCAVSDKVLNILAGDFIQLAFLRTASLGGDTFIGNINFLGWDLDYLVLG